MSKNTQKTLSENLKSIINPNLFVDMQKESGNTLRLTVEEPNNTEESNLRKFHITGIPRESIALSLEKDSNLESSWVLRDGIEKLKMKCDIVVISEIFGNLNVLIGDLKSQRPMERKYKFQLINSQLIMDYIISVLNEYFQKSDIKVEHRLVVFTNSERKKRNLNKRGANQKKKIIKKRNAKVGNFFYVENDEEKTYDDIQSKTNEVWEFKDSIKIEL